MSNTFTKGPAFITTDPIAVAFARRNRLTESVDAPLGWGDADQTPEAGQTSYIEVLDAARNIITTHSGITGTSYDVPFSSFAGNASGWLRIGSERDGYRSWQSYEIQVIFTALHTVAFALTGNPAIIGPKVSANAGSFTLTGNAAQFSVALGILGGVGSFGLTGNAATLVFSTGLVAATGSFALTGVAASFIAGVNTTLDSATKGTNVTLSNGNLTAANGGSSRTGARSVQSKSSGKYYFEMLVVSRSNTSPNEHFAGIATEEIPYTDVAKDASMAAGVYLNNNAGALILVNGINTSVVLTAPANGDRFCFAVDLDNGKFYARLNNGNWNNSGTANPATNTGGLALTNMTGMAFSPCWATPTSGNSVTFNFGDTAFTYTVPSGFTAGWPQTPDDQNTNTGYSTLLSPNNVNVTLSSGNLVVTHANTSAALARSIHQKSTGKYYFEVVATDWNNASDGVGLADSVATAANAGSNGTHVAYCYRSGNIYSNGSFSSISVGSVADGDRIGCAIDLDNQKVWFRRNNGNWNNSGTANPATNTGGISTSTYISMAPSCSFDSTGSQITTFNLGATSFVDTVPSGFTSGWPVA